MEYKKIEYLSITECLEKGKIEWKDAKSIIATNNIKEDVCHNLSEIVKINSSEIADLLINRLAELLIKDKKEFSACKKKADFEQYLSAWKEGLWRKEAQNRIKRLEGENRKIWIRCFIFLTALLFAIFVTWGWLSYKPLPNLSLKDKIEVSQYGDTILLSNYLQGTDNRTRIYIEENINIEGDEPLGYNVYRNDAHESYDIGPNQSSDYMDLSWGDSISLHKKYVIPMNCGQDVIKKRICIETYSEIFGLKIENKTDYINIYQRGGGATFMFVSEWYKPKFYANGRIDVDVNNNGIRGNSYPVFLDTDGTYVNVQISDPWITVEKRDDVEGDNYNFHIRVEENRTADKRKGTVKFTSGEKYIEFLLSQEMGYATFFEIKQDEIYVRSDEVWKDGDFAYIYGDHYSVKIDTDGIWDYKLDDDYDWIKVGKGVHNDKIEFQVRENTQGERKASIIISTLNKGIKIISITQLGVYE